MQSVKPQHRAPKESIGRPYQVLSGQGKLLDNMEGEIGEALMLRMYETMLRARMFDRQSVVLQRRGKIGTYAPFEGQEAAQVGSALALSGEDWMFPTYRDHAAMIAHGQPMYRIFLYWMGHTEGAICPPGKKIMPPCVPIATQMIHAVGTAWASRLKRENAVSLAYFGDGAGSEGDFHEALNVAGIHRTPTVFFCQNNGYAISVPFERQSSSRTIAQRAVAYDIPGIRVDGNDVFAVWLTVRAAVQRALQGEGPTLIEAVTHRYGAHTTADDPGKYRDQEAMAREWRAKGDPLARLETCLREKNLWTDDHMERLTARIREEIDEAFDEAERYPKACPIDMFNHVYAEMPWHIREQQQDLEQYRSGGGAGA